MAFYLTKDGLSQCNLPPFRVHPQTCWMVVEGHSVYVRLQIMLAVMCFGGFAIRKQHCLNIYISALSGLQILIVYFGRLQIRRNTQNNSRESLRRTGGGLQIRRNTSFLVPSDLQSDGFQVRICNPQTTLPEHLHKCFERIINPYSIFRRIANPPKHSLPLPPFTRKNPVRRSGARDFRINYMLSLSLISSAPSR